LCLSHTVSRLWELRPIRHSAGYFESPFDENSTLFGHFVDIETPKRDEREDEVDELVFFGQWCEGEENSKKDEKHPMSHPHYFIGHPHPHHVFEWHGDKNKDEIRVPLYFIDDTKSMKLFQKNPFFGEVYPKMIYSKL